MLGDKPVSWRERGGEIRITWESFGGSFCWDAAESSRGLSWRRRRNVELGRDAKIALELAMAMPKMRVCGGSQCR